MAEFSVRGQRVVVVGAARSGVAAAELLARRGARVTLTDTRRSIDEAARLRDLGIALELGGHDPVTMARAELIVTSPGVPLRQPAIEEAEREGVPVIGELELASRWLRGRIVAITGTKGKSTTTTLTGRIFEHAGMPAIVGGNIGEALSSQVDRSTPDVVHVVEVSSFQLENTVTFHPWIAVFLNFSPDHLDRHASVEEYAQAKARIFANQTAEDWAVVNADDSFVLELASRGRARRLPFALASPLTSGLVVAGDAIAQRTAGADTPLVPLSAVRLPGRHLLYDVLAAAAVGRLAGVTPAALTSAVASFAGLEHALEPVSSIGDVRFVNDSKATNVDAALRSIESFGRGLVVIMGGRYKGGDFGALGPALAARDAQVVAIGEAAPLLADALAPAVPVHAAGSMRGAVALAYSLARPGGVVLLAPACASFDMFRDYAERGRAFKGEVGRLGEDVRGVREQ
jgi:UDP-N-acetylmuramoylalanine--D-glutamate ligase